MPKLTIDELARTRERARTRLVMREGGEFRQSDIRDMKGIRICAIGTKTAHEVEKFGIKVDLIPEEFRAEGLIEAFTKKQKATSKVQRELLKGMRFLLPRAEVAREIFPDKVRELGGEIDVPVAYRTVIQPESHGKRLRRFLKEGRISIATFTSAATFNNLQEMMGKDADQLLKGVANAVIGPVTAKAVQKAGLQVHIMPEKATIEAMVESIIAWVKNHKKKVSGESA